jgi:hypothetical protein
LPSGQYREKLPNRFPAEHCRVLVVEDPSGDANCVDAYDAIFGSLFAFDSGSFECVQYYPSLCELELSIANRNFPDTIDILVVNDWIHQTAIPIPLSDEEGDGDGDDDGDDEEDEGDKNNKNDKRDKYDKYDKYD